MRRVSCLDFSDAATRGISRKSLFPLELTRHLPFPPVIVPSGARHTDVRSLPTRTVYCSNPKSHKISTANVFSELEHHRARTGGTRVSIQRSCTGTGIKELSGVNRSIAHCK